MDYGPLSSSLPSNDPVLKPYSIDGEPHWTHQNQDGKGLVKAKNRVLYRKGLG